MYKWRNGRSRPRPQSAALPQPSILWVSIRLETTTVSSQHSSFDVRPHCCHGIRRKQAAPIGPHRDTETREFLRDTAPRKAPPCGYLEWVVDLNSCRGAAPRHTHLVSSCASRRGGPIGRMSMPSAARSPRAPPSVRRSPEVSLVVLLEIEQLPAIRAHKVRSLQWLRCMA